MLFVCLTAIFIIMKFHRNYIFMNDSRKFVWHIFGSISIASDRLMRRTILWWNSNSWTQQEWERKREEEVGVGGGRTRPKTVTIKLGLMCASLKSNWKSLETELNRSIFHQIFTIEQLFMTMKKHVDKHGLHRFVVVVFTSFYLYENPEFSFGIMKVFPWTASEFLAKFVFTCESNDCIKSTKNNTNSIRNCQLQWTRQQLKVYVLYGVL